MKLALAVVLLAAPVLACAQPAAWSADPGAPSASAGASSPEPSQAVIEIRRAVPGSGKLGEDGSCVIKPVMADEDYRKCRATPPSARVGFSAPWPEHKDPKASRGFGG